MTFLSAHHILLLYHHLNYFVHASDHVYFKEMFHYFGNVPPLRESVHFCA